MAGRPKGSKNKPKPTQVSELVDPQVCRPPAGSTVIVTLDPVEGWVNGNTKRPALGFITVEQGPLMPQPRKVQYRSYMHPTDRMVHEWIFERAHDTDIFLQTEAGQARIAPDWFENGLTFVPAIPTLRVIQGGAA